METEEVIKLVDGIYKNILEKFNPGARHLISTGKAYLKALHGASAASNLFNEALAKIAVNAQQGGTIDIGSALMNIVGVYKEIQDQHMNILKAFYVDLLVPLETNLEKDTKVVQYEQKKFMQHHKIRSDSYSKAASTMKKYRKKNTKNTPKEAEKEIKSIQALEEEKHKLDQFCEQSLKNAMTQERRRYGFVLERQCSLAKHWMAYHSSGYQSLDKSLENWNEVAATREFLPPNVENMFTSKQIRDDDEDDEDDDDVHSISSQLRKTRSIDASCLDMRSLGDVVNHSMQMPRAKSEFNLTNSTTNLNTITKSENGNWERTVVKALYAYLSSGENQLSFLEGDKIALVGDRAKGWQFGENLRTQKFGWFPIAYVESDKDPSDWHKANSSANSNENENENTPDTSLESTLVDEPPSRMTSSFHEDQSPTRMFGDTIQYRQSKQFRRLSRGEKPPKPGPPPTLPAPVPTPVVPPYNKQQALSQSHSFSSSGGPPMVEKRKTPSATMNFSKGVPTSKPGSRNGIASASLHSSNDSGFSNEPPPQPEVDYSDEETLTRVPISSARSEKSMTNTLTRNNHKHDDDDYDIYGTIVPDHNRKNHNNMRQANSFGDIADRNRDPYGLRSDTESTKVKRAKSFWRFSKSDDILEGMAMWKHNDIIPTEKEKRELEKKEATLKRNMKKKNERMMKQMIVKEPPSPRPLSMENKYEKFPMTKADIDKRISKANEEFSHGTAKKKDQDRTKNKTSKSNDTNNNQYRGSFSESNDQIYGDPAPPPSVTNKVQKEKGYRTIERSERNDRSERNERNDRSERNERNERNERSERESNREEKEREKIKNRNNEAMNRYYRDPGFDDFSDSVRIHDTSFYDDDSMQDIMLMKTVKRKEILKQYYSSGTDTERHSSSSDPYDCIVVDDHLVSAADMIVRTNRNNEKNLENSNNGKKNKSSKRNEEKMNFSTFRNSTNIDDDKDSDMEMPHTGTLLPRTKLSKTSSVPAIPSVRKFESEQDLRDKSKKKSSKSSNSNSKAYGPWYDLWAKDVPMKN